MQHSPLKHSAEFVEIVISVLRNTKLWTTDCFWESGGFVAMGSSLGFLFDVRQGTVLKEVFIFDLFHNNIILNFNLQGAFSNTVYHAKQSLSDANFVVCSTGCPGERNN